mmetsp:Transcript_41540/g.81165  ORF Transcript_41540/g.81165 Transcript_41540/m.81165 type:complete len:102 (-) Transcript_41540:877-1182(-)
MVYKGGYVRTPSTDSDGSAAAAAGKATSDEVWCMKFAVAILLYVALVTTMILAVPHDIEWDFKHVLWPVAPVVTVGVFFFFFMVWYFFWDDYKEKMEKKTK